MKRLFVLAIVFALHFCGNTAFAQGSRTGLGLRFSPGGVGFTGKFFTSNKSAFELQLNAGGIGGGESFTAVGLYEYHIPVEGGWRAYLGVGAHLGVWEHNWKNDGRWKYGNEPIFGVDGIVGIEYVFRKAPIGLSLDVKPAVNLISDVDYFPHNVVGLAVRFYL
ncbi:MAG: hypothetical protein EOP56_16885 [Sphingobacteriales bacterium]|nr:MAG: hypothetical protein EOP56_16885 [Sphingobacteriales bacterium]